MNLTEKFAKVEIKQDDRITVQDKYKMDEIQEAYDNARFLLVKYKDKTNTMLEELNSDHTKPTSYNRNSQFPSKFNTPGISKLIESIDEDLELNNKQFIDGIERYYNHEYNLNLEHRQKIFKDDYHNTDEYKLEKKEYLQRELNYKIILDDLLDQAGNFIESGKDKVIEDFRYNIKTWNSWNTNIKEDEETFRIKLSKNKLSLLDYFYYINYSWENSYKFDYDNRQLTSLIKALNLFFYDRISSNNEYFDNGLNNESIDFSEINKSQNIDIKLYKNGKCELRFKSDEDANKFYNYFRLKENKK